MNTSSHPGSGSTLAASDGRSVVLGRLIKAGGAGAVYRIVDAPDIVAKVYHADQHGADYEHRITAMLAMRPELPDIADGGHRHVQLAWPLALLRDGRRRFVGFLMPAVDVDATAELELILQEKQARAAGLPTGLGAKVTLAANLAAVIAALHRQHHHVVDMKPVNLRFYPRSLYMAMLDCDGFGISGENIRFAAPQFTPEYLAPEFQRGGLGVDGEEAQDRFALAVIVFQLLNFGLHPYSGRPLHERVATDIPGRIGQRVYAYGLLGNPQIAPSPVSGHQAMPTGLRMLFDRAFERSGRERPAAAEWALGLREYAQRAQGRLVVCKRDVEHQHFAGLPCASCARADMVAELRRRAGEAQRDADRRVAAALPAGRRPPAGTRPATPARPAPMPASYPPAAGAYPPPRIIPGQPRVRPSSQHSPSLPQGCLRVIGALALLTFAFTLFLVMVRVFIGPPIKVHAPSPPYVVVSDGDGQPSRLVALADAPVRPPPPASAVATSPAPETAPAPEAPVTAVPTPPEPRFPTPTVRPDIRNWIDRLLAEAHTDDRQEWLLAMRERRGFGRHFSRGSADVADVAVSYGALDAAGRSQHRERLDLASRASRGNPHVAFESGWLAMLAGQPDAADPWFRFSLQSAPERPGAWFGLALVAPDDEHTLGALTVAEWFVRGEANAEAWRAEMRARLPGLGIDPQRWEILSARARLRIADREREDLPADIRALALQPLPPR